MRLLTTILLLMLTGGTTFAQSSGGRTHEGVLSIVVENDIFANSDGHYTNGVSLAWTTGDVATFGHRNFFARMVRGFSWLPTVNDEPYANFVAFSLNHEMYTPDDIQELDPPPDAQPYAGIVAIDTSLYSKTARSLHQYKLRVGVVGPAAGAEWLQKKIHEIIGPTPEGWDTQLSNEPLLNLDYQYSHRILRHASATGFGWDLTASGGGSLGNYFTGANVNAVVRFGKALPDTYGNFDLRAGQEALVGYAPARTAWQAHAFAAVNLVGIAHFLPTDGNTFTDSRSTTREDFAATATAGFVVGTRRLLFTFAYNALLGDRTLPGANRDDYGTIGLSYIFGGTKTARGS